MDNIKDLEEQLRQAQRLASVGLFAGGIAHDFNNLLTVILSSASLLRDLLADRPDAQEELREIEATVQRGAALTGHLLAFARRQVSQPQLVDLNQLTSGTERLLRRVIGAHIELTIALAPAPTPIWGDPAQLEQVLVNLVLNARDAMPAGGRLRIETAAVHPYAAVMISDTGHGMTPEVMARLFEPLFTTKPKGEGTGLGLAISYGIVRQNGGHIAVSSSPGEGTMFRLYFPRVESEALTTSPQESAEMPTGIETILLAEDDPSVRSTAARTLGLLGYTVLEAAHGAEALEVAAAHSGPIDLLVADVIMPHLGGRSLAVELCRIRRELRVLLTSGYAAGVLANLGRTEAAFMSKPYTPSQLARRVREILESDQNPPPPPPPDPPPDDPPLNPDPFELRGDELMVLSARLDRSPSRLENPFMSNGPAVDPTYQVGGSR
jgi:two-component system, cell cycle sensor histidine kinase and response regulator CckA